MSPEPGAPDADAAASALLVDEPTARNVTAAAAVTERAVVADTT